MLFKAFLGTPYRLQYGPLSLGLTTGRHSKDHGPWNRHAGSLPDSGRGRLGCKTPPFTASSFVSSEDTEVRVIARDLSISCDI